LISSCSPYKKIIEVDRSASKHSMLIIKSYLKVIPFPEDFYMDIRFEINNQSAKKIKIDSSEIKLFIVYNNNKYRAEINHNHPYFLIEPNSSKTIILEAEYHDSIFICKPELFSSFHFLLEVISPNEYKYDWIYRFKDQYKIRQSYEKMNENLGLRGCY
jgi:hypothetical protein